MVVDSERLDGPFWPMQPTVGSWGSTVKLASNFFQIACDPKENLFAYSLNFEPHFGAFDMKAQKEIENKINDLFSQFNPFFRKGSRLYSRQQLETVIRTIEVSTQGEMVAVTVTISPIESLSPVDANNRQSSVLFEYILEKLAGYKHHQKLGHLFFSKSGREDEKMQVIGGFTSSAGHMAGIGHFLTVDSLFRAVHRRNVLESMAANIDSLMAESPSFSPSVDDIQSEWKRRCENAVIIAYNNGRVYRVKRVRFDLNPTCLFSMKQKKKTVGGPLSEISYVDFYRRFYNRIVYDYNQPLLEVEAEKRSETVLLVPELCALTGLTEEMRKDRMLMHEVLQYSRIGTGDKLNQCVAICRELFSGSTNAPVIDTESYSGKARQLMKDWKCSLSHVPARVEARVLNPCEVSFGSKRYMVEDGNFQRWTRNGSQCPVQLSRWIVLHTEQDRQLVDMWLRSMRELGGGGFGMHFGDPMRLIMSGNPEELRTLLLDNITADIQLVMMFTPQKDSRKVYQILKQVTTTVRPCISQVVKSETMRKRQSVVAIVTRVVMQISAKMLGPLWHVNLDPTTTPMMAEPTMIVGIDTFENKEHPRKSVIGFVASTDAFISQYYSTTVLIDDLVASSRDDRNEKRYYELVAQKIRLCMHEAFEAFADANDGILPTNIIVYRNSVAKSEMKKIGQNEIEAILDSVKATNSETWDQSSATAPVDAAPSSRTKECAYDPSVTYIMCMNNVPARFFMMGSPEGPKNPPPGTVLDPVAPGSDHYSFYLVNQHVSRGSATPTHYIVGYDSSPFNVDAIQNLTFRLSHMYYNFPGGVRLPAPAQYAKKLANMVASSVQADVHPRLRETLYYL